MKGYLLLFTLLWSLSAFGQAYHPLLQPGATWDVQHYSGSGICMEQDGDRYFLQGDTLIAGNIYQIVRGYPIVPLNPGPYCPPFVVNTNISTIKAFLREDTAARKVYIWVHFNSTPNEELLYDFSVTAGDTIESGYTTLGQKLVVDSVGTTTLLNGDQRKIIHYAGNMGILYYIEGLGSNSGLFQPLMYGIGFSWGLICHQANSQPLYSNNPGQACYAVMGTKADAEARNVLLYPNPTTGQLQIENNQGSSVLLQITDLLSRPVFTQTVSSATASVDISHLPANPYLYRIIAASGATTHGKLLLVK